MWFEWGDLTNRINNWKHGISFETATLVFEDPKMIAVPDRRFEHVEACWQGIGKVDSVILFVAFILYEGEHDEEIIRIISARQATIREKRRYYAH